MADMAQTQQARHTPGPWAIRPSRDGSGDIGIAAPGVTNIVAECFAAMRRADERSPEVEANARLIAAAPELLAVAMECTELAKLAESLCGCRGDDDYVRGVQDRLDAALAKVAGRQS